MIGYKEERCEGKKERNKEGLINEKREYGEQRNKQ